MTEPEDARRLVRALWVARQGEPVRFDWGFPASQGSAILRATERRWAFEGTATG